MALTVETLKPFIHKTLLEQFPDTTEEGEEGVVVKNNATLESSVKVANQIYNELVANLPSKVVVRFDSFHFQVKNALVLLYECVLQDTAMLHSLSLSGMGINENQIFEHYLALKNAEQAEIAEMREELLNEIDKKDNDNSKLGVKIYHRVPRRTSGWRM